MIPIGVVAGIVGLSAFGPYAYSVIKGTARPNKATWLIWAVLGVVIAASYWSAGAHDSAWVPVGYALGLIVIAVLSLKYGAPGWSLLDKGCLAGAGLGMGLWAVSGEPATALYLTTAVDAVGAVPTIKKTYGDPKSESGAAWGLFLLANTLNLFAIKEWTLASASYPVYVLVLSAVMSLLILRRGGGNKKAG